MKFFVYRLPCLRIFESLRYSVLLGGYNSNLAVGCRPMSRVLRKICCKQGCTNLEITWYTRDSLARDLFVFINNTAYFTRVSFRLKFLDPWTLSFTDFFSDIFFIISEIISKISQIHRAHVYPAYTSCCIIKIYKDSNLWILSIWLERHYQRH